MKNTEFKAYTLHLTDSERDLLVKLIEKSGEFKRGALYSAADELTGDMRHVAAVSRRTCAVDVSGPSHDELVGQQRLDV